MVYPSDGIVLKNIKYGETSLIVSVYTSRFGIQTYIVKSVRKTGKSVGSHLYQPASVLEMQVYHHPLKNLQYIKEARWKIVFGNTFTHVIRNAVAQLMVELIQNAIANEEQNIQLYNFIEDKFRLLDVAALKEAANIPVFFMVQFSRHLGFAIDNNYSPHTPRFDPKEGRFTDDDQEPQIEQSDLVNRALSDVLTASSESEITGLNGQLRGEILRLLEKYYRFHIDGFNELKSLGIMESVLYD